MSPLLSGWKEVAYQEGAKCEREAGNLGEHRSSQDNEQRSGGKDIGVAHVSHAAIDRAQQSATTSDDHADACDSLCKEEMTPAHVS